MVTTPIVPAGYPTATGGFPAPTYSPPSNPFAGNTAMLLQQRAMEQQQLMQAAQFATTNQAVGGALDSDPTGWTPEQAQAQTDRALAKLSTVNPELAEQLAAQRTGQPVEDGGGFFDDLKDLAGDILSPALSVGGQLLEIIARPARIIPNLVFDAVDGGDFDPLADIGGALSGEMTHNWNAVIQEAFGVESNFFTAALGFVGDVATDPLTWLIPAGAATKLAGAAQQGGKLAGTAGVARAITGKTADDLAELGIKDADSLAKFVAGRSETEVTELLEKQWEAVSSMLGDEGVRLGQGKAGTTLAVDAQERGLAVASRLYMEGEAAAARLMWETGDTAARLIQSRTFNTAARNNLYLTSGKVINARNVKTLMEETIKRGNGKQVFEEVLAAQRALGMSDDVARQAAKGASTAAWKFGRNMASISGGTRLKMAVPFTQFRYISSPAFALSRWTPTEVGRNVTRFWAGQTGMNSLVHEIAAGRAPVAMLRDWQEGGYAKLADNPDYTPVLKKLKGRGHNLGNMMYSMSDKLGGITGPLNSTTKASRMGLAAAFGHDAAVAADNAKRDFIRGLMRRAGYDKVNLKGEVEANFALDDPDQSWDFIQNLDFFPMGVDSSSDEAVEAWFRATHPDFGRLEEKDALGAFGERGETLAGVFGQESEALVRYRSILEEAKRVARGPGEGWSDKQRELMEVFRTRWHSAREETLSREGAIGNTTQRLDDAMVIHPSQALDWQAGQGVNHEVVQGRLFYMSAKDAQAWRELKNRGVNENHIEYTEDGPGIVVRSYRQSPDDELVAVRGKDFVEMDETGNAPVPKGVEGRDAERTAADLRVEIHQKVTDSEDSLDSKLGDEFADAEEAAVKESKLLKEVLAANRPDAVGSFRTNADGGIEMVVWDPANVKRTGDVPISGADMGYYPRQANDAARKWLNGEIDKDSTQILLAEPFIRAEIERATRGKTLAEAEQITREIFIGKAREFLDPQDLDAAIARLPGRLVETNPLTADAKYIDALAHDIGAQMLGNAAERIDRMGRLVPWMMGSQPRSQLYRWDVNRGYVKALKKNRALANKVMRLKKAEAKFLESKHNDMGRAMDKMHELALLMDEKWGRDIGEDLMLVPDEADRLLSLGETVPQVRTRLDEGEQAARETIDRALADRAEYAAAEREVVEAMREAAPKPKAEPEAPAAAAEATGPKTLEQLEADVAAAEAKLDTAKLGKASEQAFDELEQAQDALSAVKKPVVEAEARWRNLSAEADEAQRALEGGVINRVETAGVVPQKGTRVGKAVKPKVEWETLDGSRFKTKKAAQAHLEDKASLTNARAEKAYAEYEALRDEASAPARPEDLVGEAPVEVYIHALDATGQKAADPKVPQAQYPMEPKYRTASTAVVQSKATGKYHVALPGRLSTEGPYILKADKSAAFDTLDEAKAFADEWERVNGTPPATAEPVTLMSGEEIREAARVETEAALKGPALTPTPLDDTQKEVLERLTILYEKRATFLDTEPEQFADEAAESKFYARQEKFDELISEVEQEASLHGVNPADARGQKPYLTREVEPLSGELGWSINGTGTIYDSKEKAGQQLQKQMEHWVRKKNIREARAAREAAEAAPEVEPYLQTGLRQNLLPDGRTAVVNEVGEVREVFDKASDAIRYIQAQQQGVIGDLDPDQIARIRREAAEATAEGITDETGIPERVLPTGERLPGVNLKSAGDELGEGGDIPKEAVQYVQTDDLWENGDFIAPAREEAGVTPNYPDPEDFDKLVKNVQDNGYPKPIEMVYYGPERPRITTGGEEIIWEGVDGNHHLQAAHRIGESYVPLVVRDAYTGEYVDITQLHPDVFRNPEAVLKQWYAKEVDAGNVYRNKKSGSVLNKEGNIIKQGGGRRVRPLADIDLDIERANADLLEIQKARAALEDGVKYRAPASAQTGTRAPGVQRTPAERAAFEVQEFQAKVGRGVATLSRKSAEAKESGRILQKLRQNLEEASQAANKAYAEAHGARAQARPALVPVETAGDLKGLTRLRVPGLEGYAMPDYIAAEWHAVLDHKGPGALAAGWRKWVLGPWKRWATYRWPGFHVRNMYGAWFNNFLGGVEITDYNFSWRVNDYGNKDWAGTKVSPKHFHQYNLAKTFGADSYGTVTYGMVKEHLSGLGIGSANGRVVVEAANSANQFEEAMSQLSRGSAGPARRTLRKVDDGMRFAGSSVEDFHRVAAWGTGMSATGGDTFGARAFVMMRHGDYADLTPAEDHIRDVVPFYKWMRTNIPYQFRMLAENPGKVTAVSSKFKDFAYGAQGMDRESIETQQPEFMRESLSIPIPEWVPFIGSDPSKGVDGISYAMADLPYTDLYSGLNDYISSVLPVGRNLIESYGFHKQAFTGKPLTGRMNKLSGAFGATWIGELLSKVPGTGVQKGADGSYYIGDRLENVLTAWPIYSRFRNFIEADEARVEARLGGFISMVGGVGVRTADSTQAELDFYYNELEPTLQAYRDMGVVFPSTQDFVRASSAVAPTGLEGIDLSGFMSTV